MPNTEEIIKNVANQDDEKKEKDTENIQLVVFELDREEYAVKITDIQEIIRIPDVTPIPNAPEFIRGIFNLRGKIIVVVNLEKRFSLVRDHEEEYEGNMIITEVNGNNYGIMVDKVSEIINIDQNIIQPTPELVSSKIHAEYLEGVAVISDNKNQEILEKIGDSKNTSNDRLIILLNLTKMLQEEELLSLGNKVKKTIDKK